VTRNEADLRDDVIRKARGVDPFVFGDRTVTGIYFLRHRPTGLGYVGQSLDVEGRVHRHFFGASHGLVGMMIGRTPIADWDWCLIEECDAGALVDREQFWIDTLETRRPTGMNAEGFDPQYYRQRAEQDR